MGKYLRTLLWLDACCHHQPSSSCERIIKRSKKVFIIRCCKRLAHVVHQRGAIYSSRPEQNDFRNNLWPWRLVSTPAGNDFRFIRKLYNNYLSAQPAALFQKYQDHESKVMIESLLRRPNDFQRSVERYTMSVIFSAVYGVRLDSLDHPILIEFNQIWDVEMKCRDHTSYKVGH